MFGRGHQRSSQRSSEVIRGHQRLSEVPRGHQRSSEVPRGHQRSSEVIRGHQRSSEGRGSEHPSRATQIECGAVKTGPGAELSLWWKHSTSGTSIDRLDGSGGGASPCSIGGGCGPNGTAHRPEIAADLMREIIRGHQWQSDLMREIIRRLSACTLQALNMQSACNQHGVNQHALTSFDSSRRDEAHRVHCRARLLYERSRSRSDARRST